MKIGLSAATSSYPKTVAGYQACSEECAKPYIGQESIVTPQAELDCFQACREATGVTLFAQLVAGQQPVTMTPAVVADQPPCAWYEVPDPKQCIAAPCPQCKTNTTLLLVAAAAIGAVFLFTGKKQA